MVVRHTGALWGVNMKRIGIELVLGVVAPAFGLGGASCPGVAIEVGSGRAIDRGAAIAAAGGEDFTVCLEPG